MIDGLVGNILAYCTIVRGSTPGLDISNKTKHEKMFLRGFPVSRFLKKNSLRVNKITNEIAPQKISRSKSLLKCGFRHTWLRSYWLFPTVNIQNRLLIWEFLGYQFIDKALNIMASIIFKSMYSYSQKYFAYTFLRKILEFCPHKV